MPPLLLQDHRRTAPRPAGVPAIEPRGDACPGAGDSHPKAGHGGVEGNGFRMRAAPAGNRLSSKLLAALACGILAPTGRGGPASESPAPAGAFLSGDDGAGNKTSSALDAGARPAAVVAAVTVEQVLRHAATGNVEAVARIAALNPQAAGGIATIAARANPAIAAAVAAAVATMIPGEAAAIAVAIAGAVPPSAVSIASGVILAVPAQASAIGDAIATALPAHSAAVLAAVAAAAPDLATVVAAALTRGHPAQAAVLVAAVAVAAPACAGPVAAAVILGAPTEAAAVIAAASAVAPPRAADAVIAAIAAAANRSAETLRQSAAEIPPEVTRAAAQAASTAAATALSAFQNPPRNSAAGAPVAQSPGGPDPKATPRAAGPPGTVPVNLPVEFTISRSSL